MSAIIFEIPNADKALILDSKSALVYPFFSPNWMDIRLGVFISLTKLSDNNDPTGLSETLVTTGLDSDRVWMGFKRSDLYLPRETAFYGLSCSGATEAGTSSVLEGGDVSQRWRYKGIANKALVISDGNSNYFDNSGTIFGPEMNAEAVPSVNAGRASLFMLRMTRATGTSSTISAFYFAKTNRSAVDYADANVFSDAPSLGLIRQNLKSGTWTSLGASVAFANVPDAVFCYWPFANSRLRVHSLCLEKFA